MEKEIEVIKKDIKNIRENHLFHIERDMAETKTNITWIMKIQWAVVSASIGGIVIGVINLL